MVVVTGIDIRKKITETGEGGEITQKMNQASGIYKTHKNFFR